MFKHKFQGFILGVISSVLCFALILSVSSDNIVNTEDNNITKFEDIELLLVNQGFISAIESVRLTDEYIMSFVDALMGTLYYGDGGQTQALIKITSEAIKDKIFEKPYNLLDSYIKMIKDLKSNKYISLYENLVECRKLADSIYKAAENFLTAVKYYERLPVETNFSQVERYYIELVDKNADLFKTITKIQTEVSELLLQMVIENNK